MPGLSRDEKRREIQRAAYRHYGRKYAAWVVFGPGAAKALFWVGLVVVAYVTWVKVPHVVLGTAALSIAAAAAGVLLWPTLSGLGLKRRIAQRISGASAPRLQLGWAYATLLITGVGMGYLALWSPFS
jgi:hypothetical protein